MPGSLSHLASRFLDVLLARPLTPHERDRVSHWLPAPLYDLFGEQSQPDQRHGYQAALSVIASGHTDEETVTAALTHDVGKRRAALGVIGRSMASVLILVGAPMSKRMTIYRDHGSIGAIDLERLDAPTLAVEYARHHHGERPDSIPAETWDVLELADQPPKARTLIRARIR
ncbi:MAG: hypothetical protein U9N56_06600 [Actinomycetota bacterium]|nr:hypothetical protein [Actinomycetota bacterium]